MVAQLNGHPCGKSHTYRIPSSSCMTKFMPSKQAPLSTSAKSARRRTNLLGAVTRAGALVSKLSLQSTDVPSLLGRNGTFELCYYISSANSLRASLNFARAHCNHMQVSGRRRIGLPPPLFPSSQRRQRNAIFLGEFLLRQMQLAPDRARRALRPHEPARCPPCPPHGCALHQGSWTKSLLNFVHVRLIVGWF
jgi:hypothetical protein